MSQLPPRLRPPTSRRRKPRLPHAGGRPASRAGHEPGHGHRGRHHHRQRHLPRPQRDDERCRLLRTRLSRVDRRRPALALRRHDLCRTGRHAALRRRRSTSTSAAPTATQQPSSICGPGSPSPSLPPSPRSPWASPAPSLLSRLPLAERSGHRRANAVALVADLRHRRHLVHYRAQLSRHQEGGRSFSSSSPRSK